MTSNIIGYQNYQKSKSLLLLSKGESLNFFKSSISFETPWRQRHTIPHLKALTSGIDNSSEHGSAELLSRATLSEKVPILLHKRAKQQFQVNIAVQLEMFVREKVGQNFDISHNCDYLYTRHVKISPKYSKFVEIFWSNLSYKPRV